MTKRAPSSARTTRPSSVLWGIRTPLAILFHIPLIALAAIVLGSCGDGGSKVLGVDSEQLPGYSTSTVDAVDGQDQEGVVGTLLPTPLTARVTTRDGRALPGITVKWSFGAGGGTTNADAAQALTELSAVTDVYGRAQVFWRLGTKAGEQTATATLPTSGSERRWVRFRSRARAGMATSVSVSPDDLRITRGESVTVNGTAVDRWNNPVWGAEVDWSSSAPEVATVSSDGTVTGESAGSAELIATSGSATGTASVAVTDVSTPSVAYVTATPGALSFTAIGAVEQITASATDASGTPVTGVSFEWRSLDPSVATVDGNGRVTAQAEGSTFVTVSASCCDAADAVEVTVTLAQESLQLAITPSTVQLQVGATSQLTATVFDGQGNPVSGAPITWSSSDDRVASVDSDGTVTAMAQGAAMIMATSSGPSGVASVSGPWAADAVTAEAEVSVEAAGTPSGDPETVSDLQVAALTSSSVSLRWTEVDDGTGQPATYALRYGSPTIQWGSDNDTEVSVDGVAIGATREYTFSGLQSDTPYEFRLVSYRGTLMVDATFGGLSNIAAATTGVGAPQSAQQVTVTPSSSTLEVGGTSQLSATVADANGNDIADAQVTWSTNAPGVARVTSSGLVTAVAVGSATITATSGSASGTASVSVSTAAVTADPGTVDDLRVVSVTDNSATLRWTQVDDGTGSPSSYALRYGTPTVLWGSAAATEIEVGGTSVGVSRDYTVTGLQAGTDYGFRLISYRGTPSVDAVYGSLSNVASGLTTTPAVQQTPTVTVTPATLSFASINATSQLSAEARDGTGSIVVNPGFSWRSLNSAIATVSGSGLVTAKAVGATAIIVSAACCGSDTTSVTVSQVPQTVTVSPASATGLNPGDTRQFTATVKDGNGSTIYGANVSWRSTNTSVATVNGTGMAMAVSGGQATIQATSGGKTGSATIGVTSPPPPQTLESVSISPASASLQTGATRQFSVTGHYSDGTSANLTASADYSQTGGSITSGGLYTAGNSAGTFRVIASSGGHADTASITITAPPPSGSGSNPNEPSGFNKFGLQDFSALVPSGWTQAHGGYSLASDYGSPGSAPSVGRMTFNSGFTGGSAPAHIGLDDKFSSSQLYIHFYFKISENWDGHSSGVNKIIFVNIGGSDRVYFSAQGVGQGNLTFQIRTQGTPDGGHNYSGSTIQRGQWYDIEVLLDKSGQMDAWINGSHAISTNTGGFGSGNWQRVAWEPTYGGGSSDSVGSTQYQYMDDLYISGR